MDCDEKWIVWLWDCFLQGVEKASLAEVDVTTTTLPYATLLPPIAARWWFPEDASLR